jgi:regulatory protein
LSPGDELDDLQIAGLQEQDSGEAALNTAIKFISYRSRTEAEIHRRLVGKGFTPLEIEKVLERLRSNGLAADEQFARSWVENRSAFHPRSRRLLAIELHQKGVSNPDIEKALEGTQDDDKLAFQAANRYANRLADLEWDKFRERLSNYLLRRGFTYGTIAPIVRSVWEDILAAKEQG